MAIRIQGEPGVAQMERPKEMFLQLGAAGEVCRSTVAIMEELVLRDPGSDIRAYVGQLEEEAAAMGVLQLAHDAIALLKEVMAAGTVDAEILDRVWDAFGPTSGMPAISAVETLQN